MEQSEIGDILSPYATERIRGWTEAIAISTSQTALGQGIFKLIDSFLWVVEKCAQWSLPAHEVAAEENGKVFGKIELVRPLPWIFFLPGLVILRIIRGAYNLGSYIFGYSRLQPSGMVKIVQKSRRQLRALNTRAMKSSRDITIAKDKRLTMVQAKKALIKSIRLTLSTLSCLDASNSSHSPPPTKIRISHTDLEQTTPDEKSTTESVESPTNKDLKRKRSDEDSSNDEISDESDDETLETKLERFATVESDEDSDFIPTECALETSSTSSDSETELEVSASEIKDITDDSNKELENIESVQMYIMRKGVEEIQRQETIPEQSDNTEDDAQFVGSSGIPSPKVANIISDFINGEAIKTVLSLQSKETGTTSEGTIEGVSNTNDNKAESPQLPVLSESEEQTSNAQKQTSEDQTQKSKARSSNANTNFLTYERKGNKHKKSGRK